MSHAVFARRGGTRLDRVERVAHWSTAALFGVLMLTGAALYAGPVSTLIGQRYLVRTIHGTAGLILPLPLLVGLVGRWGRSLRRDVRGLGRFDDEDGFSRPSAGGLLQ